MSTRNLLPGYRVPQCSCFEVGTDQHRARDREAQGARSLPPVGRDDRGRINRIELPSFTVRFTLDDDGNVVR
jgi:hypothetical protein